jgi:hypothetical protein
VSRRQIAFVAKALASVVVGWICVNPDSKFGVSRFGLTTYSRIPIPVADIQVRQDGAIRLRFKSHDIDSGRLAWLLSGKSPEVLVVGLGWEEAAHLNPAFRVPSGTRVVALPTEAALALFNSLRDRGVRVAIHVHSTC